MNMQSQDYHTDLKLCLPGDLNSENEDFFPIVSLTIGQFKTIFQVEFYQLQELGSTMLVNFRRHIIT